MYPATGVGARIFDRVVEAIAAGIECDRRLIGARVAVGRQRDTLQCMRPRQAPAWFEKLAAWHGGD